MRTPLLTLLALSACDLGLGAEAEGPTTGTTASALDAATPPPAPPSWFFLTPPVDNPGATTAAYLPGSSDVTGAGAYTYSLPLEVPPGRNGLEPRLSLEYTSAATGNGALGVGWRLGGLSSITRCGATRASDGFVDGVDLDPAGYGADATPDRLCLDGERLVLVAGSYGAAGSEYRTETTTFARITATAVDAHGPTSFEVRAADGRIRRYDVVLRPRYHVGPTQGLVADGEVRAFWPLTSDKDRAGNEIQYVYSDRVQAGAPALGGMHQLTLDEIRYTNHPEAPARRKVTFTYADRPDREVAWGSGVKSGLHLRLAAITMAAPNPVATEDVWTYRLAYGASPSSARSQLTSVARCAVVGGNPTGCAYQKQFTWSKAARTPAFDVDDRLDVPMAFDPAGYRVYETHVLDVNGDGADDLLLGQRAPYLAAPGDEDGTVTDVDLFLGDRAVSLAAPIDVLATSPAFPSTVRLGASRPLDLDGDGKVELWARYSSDVRGALPDWCASRLVRWNGQAFVDGGVGDAAFPCGESREVFLDWNGDGRLDRMSSLEQYEDTAGPGEDEMVPGPWRIALNTGAAFAPFASANLRSRCPARVIDVDGDGRGELISARATSGYAGCQVPALAFGVDQSLTPQVSTNQPSDFLGVDHHLDPRSQLGDWNGDGLEDALLFTAPDGSYAPLTATVRWNTGAGFTAPAAAPGLSLPGGSAAYATGPFNLQGGAVQVADLNRDGRDDLLVMTYAPDPGQPLLDGLQGRRMALLFAWSNGDGSFTPESMKWTLPLATYTPDMPLVRTGDFNGDGYLDVAMVQEVSASEHRLIVLRQRPSTVDVITAVRDERAAWDRESIAYSTAWSDAPEAPAGSCAYPLACVVRRGMTVVRSVATRDHLVDPTAVTAHTRYYSYVDPVSDVHAGFLGFGKTRVWDPSVPRETVTVRDPRAWATSPLHPDLRVHPSAARPVMQTTVTPIVNPGESLPVTGAWPARVERTINTNKVRFLDGGATSTVETTASVELTWEQPVDVTLLALGGERLRNVVQPASPARRVDVTTAYDDQGNPRWINELTTGGVKILRSYTYEQRPDVWLMGLLTRETETRQEADGVPQQVVRTLDHTYDARGLVATTTRQASSADPSLRSRTTRVRDAFGSIVSLSETDLATGQARTVNLVLGPTFVGQPDEHMFVRQIWSPFERLEHRPSSWIATEPARGREVAVADVNGVRTTSRIDWLGRTTRLDHDGDAATTVGYAGRTDTYGTGTINGLVATSTTGGKSVVVATGVRGEQVRTSQTGFGGGLVHVSRTYDLAGRVTRQTRPYAGTPTYAATYRYDSLGRLVEAQAPDLATTIVQHSLFETTTFSPDGARRTDRYDVDGRLIGTSQLVGADSLDTTYTWAPFDQLDKVIDDHGNVVELRYDALGRVIYRSDPDRGASELVYDALDQLLGRHHLATDHVTAFEYDGLGRRVAMTDRDGLTTFEYDSAAHGIGLVARATSPDGVVTELGYDAASRAVRRTDTIDGVAYSIDRPYDASGRNAYVQYPSVGGPALRVFATYNASDDVAQLTLDDQGAQSPLLTVTTRNLDQRLTFGTLGSNVALRHSYLPASGRVERLSALRTSTGTPLLDLTYGYDVDGHVASRTDLVAQRSERFFHDDADRLVQWNLSTPAVARTTQYRYDTIGNLDRITVDGTVMASFSFGDADGRQPHTVTGGVAGGATLAYGYDAEGRQLTAPNRAIAYRDNDLPRTVTRAGRTWTYAYDAFGKRARVSGPDGTTVYVAGVYERRTVGGEVTETFHVDGPDGRIAQLTRAGGGAPQVAFVVTDALGSTGAVTDASGALVARDYFDPFGQRTDRDGVIASALPSVRRGFTGHEHDATGLINMKGRLYDPVLKRFLTADPYVSAPLDGQAWNPYSYVGNHPLETTDPTGYRWLGEWSCLNQPGGCVDNGSAGSSGGGAGGSTATSEGAIHAMNGFIAGSLGRMGGGDTGRSDGGASSGNYQPKAKDPVVVQKVLLGQTTRGSIFEIGFDSDGHTRWITPPVDPGDLDGRDMVWRLFDMNLRRYIDVDLYLGAPLLPEIEEKYPRAQNLNGRANDYLWTHGHRRIIDPSPRSPDESAFERMIPNVDDEQELAAQAAMHHAADETVALLEPFMDEPGVAAAVEEFQSTAPFYNPKWLAPGPAWGNYQSRESFMVLRKYSDHANETLRGK